MTQSIAAAIGQTIETVRLYQNLPAYVASLEKTMYQEQDKQAALDRLRHTILDVISHERRIPLALI